MTVWSSMVAKFHDHFTRSGRRASEPERQARKAKAMERRQRRKQQEGHDFTYPTE